MCVHHFHCFKCHTHWELLNVNLQHKLLLELPICICPPDGSFLTYSNLKESSFFLCPSTSLNGATIIQLLKPKTWSYTYICSLFNIQMLFKCCIISVNEKYFRSIDFCLPFFSSTFSQASVISLLDYCSGPFPTLTFTKSLPQRSAIGML